MNSKHLASGSAFPPLKDGKLRFYNMRFCPYAQRPLLVALAKEIPLDIINVNLQQKPEWLFEKNPTGKVPTIETTQGSLYESLLVSDYLDEVYPNKPMYPKDPFQKTLDKIWIENIASKITTPFYQVLYGKDDVDVVNKGIKDLVNGLELFEEELQRRETAFFSSNESPGMLDYMVWPWVERLPAFKVLFQNEYDFDSLKDKNPGVERWRQAMKKDPAVQAYFITPENHILYMKSKWEGSPNYDLLLE